MNLEKRNEKIRNLYRKGYDISEILKMGFTNSNNEKLGKRTIELIIEKDYSKIFGKLKNSRIFDVRNLQYAMENPNCFNKIINREAKKYYKRKGKQILKKKEYTTIAKNIKFRYIILDKYNYECAECGSSFSLEIHRLKSSRKYPEEKFDIKNSTCLCHKCHRKAHEK